ncbi:hypothetical protein MJG53_009385 [Ovis ammon polii x Ovis aries]|uniref:Uncharacterized protein n=1 Tax=Ovis ammon polii x Ovis aries TaxID=2918886 RepID=A0ACB9UX68_9CETA|nr:hypothetical protein MJG53_009385 [Ovis ammon polii x Ovis aries]
MPEKWKLKVREDNTEDLSLLDKICILVFWRQVTWKYFWTEKNAFIPQSPLTLCFRVDICKDAKTPVSKGKCHVGGRGRDSKQTQRERGSGELRQRQCCLFLHINLWHGADVFSAVKSGGLADARAVNCEMPGATSIESHSSVTTIAIRIPCTVTAILYLKSLCNISDYLQQKVEALDLLSSDWILTDTVQDPDGFKRTFHQISSVFDYEMLPQIPTEDVKGEHVYHITFIKYENSEHVDTYDHTVSEEGLWIINWFSLICYFSTLMLDYRIGSMKITEKCSVDLFPDSKGRLQHDRIKSETQAKNGNKTNELSDKWKQKMPRNQCSTGEPEVPPTPTLPRRYTCSISFLCHVAPFWYT